MAESILKLKVASEEYENKLKRASEGLQKYIEGCRKVGGTLEHLDDGVLDFVKALGSMETKSTSARGKINELKKSFTDMKVEYLQMTEAEKNGDIGKALSKSLDQMKTRFRDAKDELAEINKELNDVGAEGGSKFGQFGNVLDTIGHKLGLTANATELLTSKTALMYSGIGAGIAIIGKATDAWTKYNAELAKQDQITVVTTGLKDDDAKRMTDTMRALSDTYNVDFREAINAANTLMTQFGKTGDEAMQLLKDGMQGMIQGDGPKMLAMIKQFAPAFRDAGISAEQLIAIIHNSEGGLFSDENMNAILMGIKNIRNMTDQTAKDLANLGINGEEMSKKMSDGTMSVFQALQKVSEALENANAGSKEAGRVMQDVFGRQGAMQGMKLSRAIAELNTNLEETKKQTGEVGEAFGELQAANERLNVAIREAFSYDGWEQMAMGIKTSLIGALADVIEHLAIIKEGFSSLFGGGKKNNKNDIPNNDPRQNPNRYEVTTDSNGNVINATKYNNGRVIDMTGYEQAQQGVVVTGHRPIKSTGKGGKNGNTGIDKEEVNRAKMLAELRKEELKATKEIAAIRAKEHQTETIGTSGFNEQNIANWTSMMKDQMSKADFGSVVYDSIEENLRDMTTITDLTKEALKRGLSPESLGLTELFETAFDGIDVPDDTLQAIVEKINAAIKDGVKLEINRGSGKVNEKKEEKPENKQDKSFVEVAGKLDGGINNMVSSLDRLGLEIPEGFQSVLSGIQSMLGVLQSIALIVEAIEAMQQVGTFLGIFHNGGIVPHAANGYYVPGNRFSGDTTPVLANAGELILNKAAQSSIASQLEGVNSMQNMKLEAIVTGEQIRLALNNNGRRTGRGEYVQTNRM